MSREELTLRLLCAMAGVNSRAVRTGTMTPDERKKLSDAGERFATTRAIRIDDRPRMTVAEFAVRPAAFLRTVWPWSSSIICN